MQSKVGTNTTDKTYTHAFALEVHSFLQPLSSFLIYGLWSILCFPKLTYTHILTSNNGVVLPRDEPVALLIRLISVLVCILHIPMLPPVQALMAAQCHLTSKERPSAKRMNRKGKTQQKAYRAKGM